MAVATRELEQFVHAALSRGESKQSVLAALSAAGWSPEQAASALDAYADVPFAVPVPKPRPYLSAREAFLYLVLFATLYVSAFELGSLLFDLVNRAFPDPADLEWQVSRAAASMRWAVAAIAVAFPVFLFVANLLGKEMARNPVKRLSAVRRWLTYVTLFLAAGIVIGDLITLLYNVLGGELSTRFLLKVLIVGAIAGTIFGYYLLDLRREEKES
ncbi:MAG: DUF5671 domain-containing protein [Pseudomonadota bacterium]|nr:DUF5671 domain-containing protein [Pseudomonadota bacterium]